MTCVLFVSTPEFRILDAEMTALYLQLRSHLGAAMMLVTPGVERAEIVAASWWAGHGMPVVDVPPRDKDGTERVGKGANYILTTFNPDFGIIAGQDKHTNIYREKLVRNQIRHIVLGTTGGIEE